MNIFLLYNELNLELNRIKVEKKIFKCSNKNLNKNEFFASLFLLAHHIVLPPSNVTQYQKNHSMLLKFGTQRFLY